MKYGAGLFRQGVRTYTLTRISTDIVRYIESCRTPHVKWSLLCGFVLV